MIVPLEKPGTPEQLVYLSGKRREWDDKPGTPQELVHFGVKGMKWGVRQKVETVGREVGQIKEKRAARKERKAKGFEANARANQKEIDRIRANPSRNVFVQAHRNHRIANLQDDRDQQLNDAHAVRTGHLTSRQKKVIIGAAAVGVVLAAYGVHKAIDTGQYHAFVTRNIPLKRKPSLSRKMSPDEIMKEVVDQVNPNFYTEAIGPRLNCRRCTFAFEQRRRGFDVQATHTITGSGQTFAGLMNATDPKTNIGTGPFSLGPRMLKEKVFGGPTKELQKITPHGLGKENLFVDSKEGPSAVTARIFGMLGRHPDGARGELGVSWKQGAAHSVAWENIGGKVHIFDTQQGIELSPDDFTKTYAPLIEHAGATRLDNIPLNESFLRRWISNVN